MITNKGEDGNVHPKSTKVARLSTLLEEIQVAQ